jgi:hypothetical protein
MTRKPQKALQVQLTFGSQIRNRTIMKMNTPLSMRLVWKGCEDLKEYSEKKKGPIREIGFQ